MLPPATDSAPLPAAANGTLSYATGTAGCADVLAPCSVDGEASLPEAGLPQRTGEGHRLLLARAGVPGGEQLPRDLTVLVHDEGCGRREGYWGTRGPTPVGASCR